MIGRWLLLVVLAAAPVYAQPAPPALLAADVVERPGAQVPVDTRFTSTTGAQVQLRDVFAAKRPVVLVLAYARCTMVCSLVLRGVADSVARIAPTAGRDYDLVLIGLDARETIDEARRKHTALNDDLAHGEWLYLVGARGAIDAVANAVGFRYAWDQRTEQYAHPAVIFVLTPDGRVARYLHGIQFAADELEAALADAAAGRTLSTAAADVLRCFRFDPALRRDGRRALQVLRIGAACMFAVLLATIISLICWERRRGRLL